LTTYEQSEIISVTAVEHTGTVMTFTGSGFPTAGYIGHATFAGVNATTVTIVSETSVEADFSEIGIAATTAIPELYFQSIADTHNHDWANLNELTITKPLSVTSSTASLSCSYAGGCNYEIVSDGLYALLTDKENQVDVCGNRCVVDEL
jgi:hypothetical protein